MRIGVISDTHGNLASVKRAVDAAGEVELWLHAGDHSDDGEYLREITKVQVVAVRGNCDGQALAKVDEFLELDGMMIWLTHGHRYHVKQGLAELRYWARQYEATIAVYGHTHVPEFLQEKGLTLFNPGSASFPVGGNLPTFGIIEFNNNLISARHIKIMAK